MTPDLDEFTRRAGVSARRVRDDDFAYGREPVWATAEQAWVEWSNAILRKPTAELRALFMQGWQEHE